MRKNSHVDHTAALQLQDMNNPSTVTNTHQYHDTATEQAEKGSLIT